jgi:hypothetical protein
VVTRAAEVHRVLRPWHRVRAVADLGGQLAAIAGTEG